MSKWRVGQKVRLLPYDECMDIDEGPGWIPRTYAEDDNMDDLVGKIVTVRYTGPDEWEGDWIQLEGSRWKYDEQWFIPVEVEMEYV